MTGYALTFGETMALVSAAEAGSLATVRSMTLGIGGADSNVAVGLARLGVPVVWTGRVGDDPLGRRVVRELRAEGVDVRALVDPEAPTGLMVKERRIPESSQIVFYRSGSAGSRLAAADVPDELVRDAAIVHVSGITPALSESALECCRHVLAQAEAFGVPVSFDVNHRASLWRGIDRADERATELYRSIARRARLVFCGEDEAAMLAGREGAARSLAAAIAELGPRTVVVKRGAEGSVCLQDGVLWERAAHPVSVVDSVGAGDGFVAGYLAEHLLGHGPERCLETASAAGAFACTVLGDWEGAPRRSELSLLESNDPVTR